MINAEGAKGHQYADEFTYIATDITMPYRPERYTEALNASLALEPKPAVVIIDSGSHMHDGPGGLLEYHEDELDRMAGKTDYKKRDRMNWTAWITPKAAENAFIYAMLSADCHIILCFRAKEKIKIVKGAEPIELGWQPIAGERIAFETIFTLTLPPHSKGVPDLAASEMRTPFDEMIPAGQQLSEDTGAKLAAWAAGGAAPAPATVDWSEADALVPLLLAYYEDDKKDAVRAHVDANRRDHPGKHVDWLKAQIEKKDGEVAAADLADEPEQTEFRIPDGVQA
jgi:hypothetical protein